MWGCSHRESLELCLGGRIDNIQKPSQLRHPVPGVVQAVAGVSSQNPLKRRCFAREVVSLCPLPHGSFAFSRQPMFSSLLLKQHRTSSRIAAKAADYMWTGQPTTLPWHFTAAAFRPARVTSTPLVRMPRAVVPMGCAAIPQPSVVRETVRPTATPRRSVASTGSKAVKTALLACAAHSSGRLISSWKRSTLANRFQILRVY